MEASPEELRQLIAADLRAAVAESDRIGQTFARGGSSLPHSTGS
jgi:hypothetical protein